MLELARGQVDLWSCNYLEIHSETLLRQYWALLTDAERQQQLRFRFPADQRRYLERLGEVRRDAEIAIRETVPLQGDKLIRVQVRRQSV
jgi:hypothetical protein